METAFMTARSGALATVIVSCCGQLEYTRFCAPSVSRHSRQPVEVVFLDCDSMDGTAEYLEGFAAAAPFRIEVVRVPAEPPLERHRKDDQVPVRGEYVALLNNDTIVTPFWLDRLVSLAGSAAEVGMVAPVSNHPLTPTPSPPTGRGEQAGHPLTPTPSPPTGRGEHEDAPAPFVIDRVLPYGVELVEDGSAGPRGAVTAALEKVARFGRQWQEEHAVLIAV
jgi:hypothetical protein